MTGAGAGLPVSAQRLTNGNIFIATRSGVMEIDRDGIVRAVSYGPPPSGFLDQQISQIL